MEFEKLAGLKITLMSTESVAISATHMGRRPIGGGGLRLHRCAPSTISVDPNFDHGIFAVLLIFFFYKFNIKFGHL